MDDPRLTPARPDLAAKYLEGKVKAARFVSGEAFEIGEAIAPMRGAAASLAESAARISVKLMSRMNTRWRKIQSLRTVDQRTEANQGRR